MIRIAPRVLLTTTDDDGSVANSAGLSRLLYKLECFRDLLHELLNIGSKDFSSDSLYGVPSL